MSEHEKPNPSKVPTPHPRVARDEAHSVVSGMGVVRKRLFASPTNQGDWQKQMLTHIEAAKQLGFTMFEIETVSGWVPRQKEKKAQEGYVTLSNMWGMVAQQIEGEEWKVVKEEEPEPDAKAAMMKTTFVRVYALAVE